ncbi:peptidase family M28 [Colletotrichum kahawae]|uniref:Peptide hydrolase n=1 Tax=Colletotrichum kahawae TaxID=34407 RepID=A0AAE0CX56_COLKA|nr:peptidase family M28 [Colletotrichum kahawae]
MKFSKTTAATVLSLASGAAAAANETCRPKVDSDQLQADLTTENLMANLEALNEIAFANGGNRAFGLPGYAASVDYVWDRISSIPATRAWKQDFPATFGQVVSIDLSIGDESIYVFGLTYSPSTSEEGITAELALGPEGAAGCDAANYEGLDVAGKIERLDAGESVTARFQQTQIVEERITQNVFVETEEGDPHNVVMLGAHLDSVQAGPGINDDGSGTSLLLELFLALTKYRTKNKVRFAWWGAEENGLLGSKYYCANLPPSDVDDLLVYLNFDMVSKGFFGVADTDGSSHGSVAPAGSDVVEHIYEAYFAGKGHAVTPAVLTNGSDYASFWQILNKPFGFLHTGTAVAQDPCYHQACDTIENPDPEVITVNARAAAHMVTVLSLNGTELIPKTSVNATMLSHFQTRSLEPDVIWIEELEALGERHLGCGHDI